MPSRQKDHTQGEPVNSHHHTHDDRTPAPLLVEHLSFLVAEPLPGPVLDLASGECQNGIFLARHHLPVICCDASAEALARGKARAFHEGVQIQTWTVDLEQEGDNPLPENAYGGIIVFRYLHRPLMPNLKRALAKRGILIYETYTVEQPQFGKPHNPAFLLKPGELRAWFDDWEIIHYFEGQRNDPLRAVAQIVCRKS